ncbi:MAG: hypothetical protein ACTHWA_04835 [Arachnia sp.]
MNIVWWIPVVVILAVLIVGLGVVLLRQRKRLPKYDTYQVGEYNSPGEAPHQGPPRQHEPVSHPIGFSS